MLDGTGMGGCAPSAAQAAPLQPPKLKTDDTCRRAMAALPFRLPSEDRDV